MANLEDDLIRWYKSVVKNATLTTEQKEEITHAGAEAYARQLREVTKEKHYREHDGYHLMDAIKVQKGDLDNTRDGSSVVGFTNDHNRAHIARFLNDGTRYIQGDHFVDNTREQAREAVFEAQARKFKEITKGGESE